MILENLNDYTIVLASKSPRRKSLLEKLGLTFEVKILDVEETYPENLSTEEIPQYLAELKASPFINEIDDKTLIITSDTIVSVGDEVMGKPANYNDAFTMLQKLSGQWHNVSTGVYLLSKYKKVSFTSVTRVLFKELTTEEIDY